MNRKASVTTDARFRFDVLRSELPVLVEFGADWCRPCQLIAPVLDELAAAWAERIQVVKIDVERDSSTAQRYGVQSLPTLIYFHRGEEIDRLIGVIRRQAIEDHIATHTFSRAA